MGPGGSYSTRRYGMRHNMVARRIGLGRNGATGKPATCFVADDLAQPPESAPRRCVPRSRQLTHSLPVPPPYLNSKKLDIANGFLRIALRDASRVSGSCQIVLGTAVARCHMPAAASRHRRSKRDPGLRGANPCSGSAQASPLRMRRPDSVPLNSQPRLDLATRAPPTRRPSFDSVPSDLALVAPRGP